MISSKNGTGTLEFEITNIERMGFWILIDNREYFASFNDFPDFKEATIEQILNVKRIDQKQYHWPDLDIDIDIDSLESPEDFPLIYRK